MSDHQDALAEPLQAPDDHGADGGAAAFEFPRHDDGWEPGAPSIKALLPSLVAGALIPIAVYNLVRPHVTNDATALAIAGIPAATWVAVEWVRRRTLDPIGTVVLVGFVGGVIASVALGGNAFVLKARDSAVTCLFGLACVVSLTFRRPLMFYFGRSFSAGDDPERMAVFDRLWDMPPARAVFRIITLLWGVGLLVDASVRVTLAAVLPTRVFLVVSPSVSAVFIGTMFAATVAFVRVSRQGAGDAMAAEDIPPGGGSTWWWTTRYIVPTALGRRRPAETGATGA